MLRGSLPPRFASLCHCAERKGWLSQLFPQEPCEHICGKPPLSCFIDILNFIRLNIFPSTDMPTFLHPNVPWRKFSPHISESFICQPFKMILSKISFKLQDLSSVLPDPPLLPSLHLSLPLLLFITIIVVVILNNLFPPIWDTLFLS